MIFHWNQFHTMHDLCERICKKTCCFFDIRSTIIIQNRTRNKLIWTCITATNNLSKLFFMYKFLSVATLITSGFQIRKQSDFALWIALAFCCSKWLNCGSLWILLLHLIRHTKMCMFASWIRRFIDCHCQRWNSDKVLKK